MTENVQDTVVLITRANGGMDEAARKFAASGANVVLGGIPQQILQYLNR